MSNTEETVDCQYISRQSYWCNSIDEYNGRLYAEDSYLLKKNTDVVICPLLSPVNRTWSIDKGILYNIGISVDLPSGLSFDNGMIFGSSNITSNNVTYTIQVQEMYPKEQVYSQSINISIYCISYYFFFNYSYLL